ncbi:protein FAM229A isoform X1 [Antechinus flavipes]|uniref:protein FAM229A isoform X1 n=1 Tax=Antechinus flavipes TaxID=38775 RepID=UPI0022368DCC|nr:protein FAM229A isoform X1 [Antechinus flavipes]
MQPAPSTARLRRAPRPAAPDTCPATPGPERPPAARARAAVSRLGPAPASSRASRGPDMSAQEPPQGRRFPIEAGDSPGLAAAPEPQDSAEPVATEHTPVRPGASNLQLLRPPPPPRSLPSRPLRRCPGCHCLTLLHVPIDVYLAMGGSPRARAT